MPDGMAVVGSARLPVITLFEIVTVAPLAGGLLAGKDRRGISTPPPMAHTPATPKIGTDRGLERAIPPVIVTPLIDTTGSRVAPKAPIVSTWRPPRMMVDDAPGPWILRLVTILTPPL